DAGIYKSGFTKQQFISLDISDYRVILFAAPILLPDYQQCLTDPAIIFSASSNAASVGREFLGTAEIAKLRLNADIVAVIGSDTRGRDRVGDSLAELAKAFFDAGAHGLLVTHWPVVTTALVSPLARALFEADSAQGLRAAQLTLIDTAGTGPDAPVEISH